MDIDILTKYADMAVQVNELQTQLSLANIEIEQIKQDSISKTELRTWFSSIDENYVWLNDEGKASAIESLGAK